jgi:CubicO group peptidase (beta-lactamase class C family)
MTSATQISLAVAGNGQVATQTGVRAPVPWWSFTKTVIAAGALVLVRDGRLALDEPLTDRPYSLRQLLQHRAGVAEYGELPAYHEAVKRGDAPWPVSELLERTDARRLRFEPGTRWSYSNIGYLFVRRLIEAACGEPLGAALARLVLAPLGIDDARVVVTPDDLAGVEMGNAASYHPGWVYHGLMVGRLEQAALLLARLMTASLLPRELLAQMCSGVDLGAWAGPRYGLGLLVGSTALGTPVAGHTGKGPGSVIAVYHAVERTPPVTAAAFTTGDDTATVEHAAFAALRG